jgi:molybdate transport system substrate-binding protein
MEALEKQGRLVSGSARRVASSGVGFATRKGAPKPDISTREALVRTLLSARCIAYSDPSGGGASGIHFAEVVQRLGIAREVDAKARKAKGALNGEALLSGEADLAVQQIPELLAVQGIEFVGPLPGELQLMTPFSAGVIAATGNLGEAQRVIEFVASEDGARILSAHGFDR